MTTAREQVRTNLLDEKYGEERNNLMEAMKDDVADELETIMRPIIENQLIDESKEKMRITIDNEIDNLYRIKKKELEEEYYDRMEKMKND